MFQKINDRTKKNIVVVTTAVSFLAFGFILAHATLYAPDSSITVPQKVISTTSSGATSDYPVQLEIPSLQVDANVQYVGVAKSGNMAVPNNFTDVGWYRGGTIPGDVGSAVIDGHVDNGLSLPGVFKHLNEIKIGDDIYVVNKKGKKLHFIVRGIETYPYKDVPTDILFNRKDTARLNLVTCDGGWVQNDKTYDHRLAVYAVLADS